MEKAEEHHKRALEIDQAIGNKLGEAEDLGNLGGIAAERDNPGEARALLQRAVALYEAIGAGGEGPEAVAEALQRLESPPAEE